MKTKFLGIKACKLGKQIGEALICLMMVFDVAKHLGEIQTFDGYISSGVDLS